MNYLHLIIIGLVLFILVLLWIVRNQLYQTIYLEKIVKEENESKIQTELDAITFYEKQLDIFVHAGLEMDKIDQRGSFSGDDEVGFAFQVIKRSIDHTLEKLKSFKKEG